MTLIIKKYFKSVFILTFIFLGVYSFAYASTTNGTIDNTNKTALLCKDNACVTVPTSASKINFKPASLLSSQVVHITDTEITGFAWSEDMGWIVLNCSNTTSGCSPTNGNFKIKNDAEGHLSGYAWGQNAGWINFGPFLHNDATPVSINISGQFTGWAWAQNYGWIKFDCAVTDGCVKTDWRPASTRDSGGGTVISGGGGTTSPVVPPVVPPIVPPVIPPVIPPAPTFCELHPTDETCTGTTPTFCELHPTNETCTGTTPTFCELHPTDETCTGTTPTFCELHPTDETCTGVLPTEPTDSSESNDGNSHNLADAISRFFSGNNDKGFSITQVIVDNILENIKIAEIAIKKVAINTIEAMKTPVGRTVTDIVTAIGVISGASISIATLMFANPLTFSELFLIPLRLWSLILAALGIKKRSRPWGTVYDSITKQPLDPAYVVLQDLNGNEVATSITDLDGRYGFLVPSGQYRLIANKTNYEFPSKRLSGKIEDELYQDLYFNEILNIKEGEVITKNIPMDPLKFDWNEFAKKDQKLMKFFSKRDVFIARLSNFLFIFGFFWTTIAVLVTPKVYNIIIFCIYGVLYVLKHTVLKRSPSGTITENGEPLSFAIVRVFSVEAQHEIIHKVADKTGKYYCLIPNGNYYVKIEKKNEDGSYALVYTSNPIEVRKGYIGDKFKI